MQTMAAPLGFKKENDSTKKIKENIATADSKVRVTFRDAERSPMYGMFKALNDGQELASKNLVRFLPDSKIETFRITNSSSQTKIFDVTTFAHIIIYYNGK